jgi:hypothetical protein
MYSSSSSSCIDMRHTRHTLQFIFENFHRNVLEYIAKLLTNEENDEKIVVIVNQYSFYCNMKKLRNSLYCSMKEIFVVFITYGFTYDIDPYILPSEDLNSERNYILFRHILLDTEQPWKSLQKIVENGKYFSVA